MLKAFKMRLYGGLFLLASTIFMGLFMLLMCIVISTKWLLPSVQIPLVDSWRFYKFAMHRSMEQSHIFIPASHPHIRVRSASSVAWNGIDINAVYWTLDINC
jgi:hypothetical protein